MISPSLLALLRTAPLRLLKYFRYITGIAKIRLCQKAQIIG